MVAMIKRILNLAGKHKSKILLGILFNFLKSVCMAMVLWAVYIVASDLDSLTMDVIWKAFAVLCISVLGRFFFQWLMDISMSAKGFDIFRDYRLHVGSLMRKAPMGYFSEQRLGSIQNVLTTTVTELEQYSMMAVTDLTSGALMALVTLGELIAVLDTCTEAQRRRFLLYALDGLTLAEIGTVCGCSKVSVYRDK